MANPLYDKEFLKQLYMNNNKELFAKIVALNTYEEPVEELQGIVTGGSINVDGNSAVRRTCSLTMVVNNIELTDYYWGIKTKFNLSIGLRNLINKEYPDIIWFPQGTYIISTFNSSQSTNSFNISLSGKDKMCLLNGEMSGSLHANSTRFDIIDEYDATGTLKQTKIPIKDIIKEMVHGHAGEPMHNIIINDLDDFGLELLDYQGVDPLYVLFDNATGEVDNIRLDNPKPGTFVVDDDFKELITNNGLFIGREGKSFIEGKKTYNVAKIEGGNTAGYRLTELVYPGELVANAGESVTSILDKIKTMLGDYEYFYDIDGRFIFQRKKVYTSTSWNNLRTGNDGVVYADAAAYSTPNLWSFEGNEMLTSISNTPDLNNLKNDFSVWGTRKSANGSDVPIHLRYAVDKKPEQYKTIREITQYDQEGNKVTRKAGVTYIAANDYNKSPDGLTVRCDYREIIYQMAMDYRKGNRDDNFVSDLMAANPLTCQRGKTGYEQYYVDMEGFWRQLYDPNRAGVTDSGYATDCWHRDVTKDPSSLNFWIDFLDTDGSISKYSIPVIGDRAKIVNDTAIKAIYFKDTPLIIYYKTMEEVEGGSGAETLNTPYKKPGYTYAQLSNIERLFKVSSQGKTAKSELDNLLYTYTYCSEQISLNSVPIYSLQVNNHISVKDDENISINGDYIISRITIPLNYNGLMSISATKVPEKIL